MVKPDLSVEVIRNELRARMGPVEDFRRLVEGEESQAFRFTHEGAAFVIRINPAREGFDKDRYAWKKFASPSLPIPEVIEIGAIGDGLAYCVSRFVPGVTLQDLDTGQLPATLKPTADVLEAIAASNLAGTSGCGPFDKRGVGRCTSWRQFLLEAAEPARYDWSALADVVDLPHIERLLAELTRCAVSCPEERRLVHGDFGSNNVLTDGKAITGVIDWSEAMFGDPLYDVANVFHWRT